MRSLLAAATFTLLLTVSSAQAERRIFIIANHADGYGVDRCLANSESCGKAAAAAYCKSRDYAEAASYSKVDREEITGAIPVSTQTCRGSNCEEFVAIVCTR